VASRKASMPGSVTFLAFPRAIRMDCGHRALLDRATRRPPAYPSRPSHLCSNNSKHLPFGNALSYGRARGHEVRFCERQAVVCLGARTGRVIGKREREPGPLATRSALWLS
jgi:hypothetical protein